ncbi:SDR family NAD(P)-dependent oxidoreductase [Inquilinus limosus]|uniref:Oxidoreductase n=1 Tax=Inquilinus limosus MP06 TaxID=1398085 RepID=A0A0A0CXL6_9PROT|nr:SDR family oxidoreductase [Inquilinus limosus]KGM30534.1 oxidoreductase [Inquilinus limosus MP06]
MKIDLSGKSALVTGSTTGIGFAIAQGLAAAGAEVIVNGRKPAAVAEAVERIGRAVPGAKLRPAVADVSSAEGCAELAAAVPEADILVNNVGTFEMKEFFDIPDEDWQHIHDVNVMSGVRLSRAYMKGMLARNWGRVVFISSESGVNIPIEMIHYGVTKTAQIALARGLAKLTRGTGVTVNSVLPGPTMTDGVREFLREMAAESGKSIEETAGDFVRTHRPTSIIGRMAAPEEIANMVVYVASPQAAATNGAALRVDGGVLDTLA